MWTGWDGNDGKGGGPVIANDELGYGWTTYPERLQAAGISWKIYQDSGVGLDKAGFWGWTSDPYIGNYGDNSLLYFHQLPERGPGQPAVPGALAPGPSIVDKSGDGFFDILAADVQHDRLPSVSWIVAPEAYTEHPAWPAGYGAWYTRGVLNALTSNPEVWSKTALFDQLRRERRLLRPHRRRPTRNVGDARRASRPCRSTNELFAGTAGRRALRRPGRTASACACRCSWSRRGAAAAGSAPRSSTTPR